MNNKKVTRISKKQPPVPVSGAEPSSPVVPPREPAKPSPPPNMPPPSQSNGLPPVTVRKIIASHNYRPGSGGAMMQTTFLENIEHLLMETNALLRVLCEKQK